MKAAWGLVVLAALLLAGSGCQVMRAIDKQACHEPQPYMKAHSVAPLKIPAGLDAPDTTNALRLPALNEPAPPPRTRQAAVPRRAAAVQGAAGPRARRRPDTRAARAVHTLRRMPYHSCPSAVGRAARFCLRSSL